MSIIVFFVPTQLSKALGIRKEPLHWLDIATLKREETKRMVSLFDELVFTTIMRLRSLLIEFQSF